MRQNPKPVPRPGSGPRPGRRTRTRRPRHSWCSSRPDRLAAASRLRQQRPRRVDRAPPRESRQRPPHEPAQERRRLQRSPAASGLSIFAASILASSISPRESQTVDYKGVRQGEQTCRREERRGAEPGACISVLRRNAAEQSPWVGLLARRGQSRLPCASLPRPDSVEWLLKRRTSLTVAEPRRICTGLPCYVPKDTLGTWSYSTDSAVELRGFLSVRRTLADASMESWRDGL